MHKQQQQQVAARARLQPAHAQKKKIGALQEAAGKPRLSANLTYTNAGGISEYLLFAPLVRRPGAPRLAAQQRPQITCRTRSLSGEICMSM